MKTMKKALLPALVALILAGPVSAEFATPSGTTQETIDQVATITVAVDTAIADENATTETIGQAVEDSITQSLTTGATAEQQDAALQIAASGTVGKVLDANQSQEVVVATAERTVAAVADQPEKLVVAVDAMMNTAAGDKAKPQDVYNLVKGTVSSTSENAATSVSNVVSTIFVSFSSSSTAKQQQALRGIEDAFGIAADSGKFTSAQLDALEADILTGAEGNLTTGQRQALVNKLRAAKNKAKVKAG